MNETAAVRKGEELDSDRLADFLRQSLPTPFVDLNVLQFPAGSSNLTYLLKLGSVEYVLRRPPFGNTVKTAHDMRREFEVLKRLAIVYPLAPEPVLFCADASVIGSEFYLMERRNGLIIRGKAPEMIEASHEMQQKVCRSFINNLARLHSVDYEFAGLGDLGKPEGYCRRQVEGWTKRYEAAKTHDHHELEEAIGWLNKEIPVESGASLVHNDYKFDNVMLDPADPARVMAVLDWEMVTIGDPLMDLGTTLGYWMSPDVGDDLLNMPFNPRVLMENISRRDLVEMYETASGREASNILYYYVFGSVKVAVIAQQIYSRFVTGATRDPRFQSFDKLVAKLGNIAAGAIESEDI
jgi:aminoglycoside phosphotransferase (APT) family kinase protein